MRGNGSFHWMKMGACGGVSLEDGRVCGGVSLEDDGSQWERSTRG